MEDEIDVSRGEMLVHPDNLPTVSRNFEAMLVWMDEEPMDATKQFFIKQTTNISRASIDAIKYQIDVNTMERSEVDHLSLNEIGRVVFSSAKELFFDPYLKNRATGAFILIDPITNNTSAVGMILNEVEGKDFESDGTPEISLSKLGASEADKELLKQVVQELSRQGLAVRLVD